jgi:histidinol-phosphate phosphatase family protein
MHTLPGSHSLDESERGAVFLDKDGTLVEDVPYNVDPRQMRFARSAAKALTVFAALRMPLIVVSNQPGVALGRFAIAALEQVEAQLIRMFESCGAVLSGFYYCPHHPEGSIARFRQACACRKPQPGMLLRACERQQLSPARSWMIGDILDDIEAGRAAGCRTILIDNGNETLWEGGPLREPHHVVGNLEEAAFVVARAQAQCPEAVPKDRPASLRNFAGSRA